MRLRATTLLRNDAMVEARKKLGLSQRDLGDLVGLNINLVAKIERLDFRLSARVMHTLPVIASELGITIDEIMPEEMRGIHFMNKRVDVQDVSPDRLLNFADRHILPEPSTDKEELSEELQKAIGKLSFRMREIVRMRLAGITLIECGKRFKVTRERVRGIEIQGLNKLRKMRDVKKLEIFLPETAKNPKQHELESKRRSSITGRKGDQICLRCDGWGSVLQSADGRRLPCTRCNGNGVRKLEEAEVARPWGRRW